LYNRTSTNHNNGFIELAWCYLCPYGWKYMLPKRYHPPAVGLSKRRRDDVTGDVTLHVCEWLMMQSRA